MSKINFGVALTKPGVTYNGSNTIAVNNDANQNSTPLLSVCDLLKKDGCFMTPSAGIPQTIPIKSY